MTTPRLPAAWLRNRIERDYPNLIGSGWKLRSPGTYNYQCIAWAACDTTRRWWPIGDPPVTYWPPTVPAEESVDAFIQAFATIGYQTCENDAFEFGFQKVALYVDEDGTPSHMARQRFFGHGWLSKIGDWEDIAHPELTNLEGQTGPISRGYGTVQTILKRSWLRAAKYGLFHGCWASCCFWFERIKHPAQFR